MNSGKKYRAHQERKANGQQAETEEAAAAGAESGQSEVDENDETLPLLQDHKSVVDTNAMPN